MPSAPKFVFILMEDDDVRHVAGEALASTRNLPLLSLLEAAWSSSRSEDEGEPLRDASARQRRHPYGWRPVVSIEL
jgi:hypothetical protein